MAIPEKGEVKEIEGKEYFVFDPTKEQVAQFPLRDTPVNLHISFMTLPGYMASEHDEDGRAIPGTEYWMNPCISMSAYLVNKEKILMTTTVRSRPIQIPREEYLDRVKSFDPVDIREHYIEVLEMTANVIRETFEREPGASNAQA